jgi:hypothetical protein
MVVMDMDTTLITAHSERGRPTFKHGFGFHPIGASCDNTHELFAVTLRSGNARRNHARITSMSSARHRQIPAGPPASCWTG